MSARPTVIVDPHYRRMSEIFSPDDLARLHRTVEVVWGRDEPMPLGAAVAALRDAVAIVCTDWRYGEVLEQAPLLRAIISVSGAFPRGLNYDKCFARGVRVLSVAPAFGRQVAEMALGMALAACRDIVAGDAAMRAGTERYLHEGNIGTFMLYGKRVGIIGYGGIARCLRPLLDAFGCEIAAYDPWLADGYLRSLGVRPLPLAELLATSKVTFVLAPPTHENKALLSRDLLEKMPLGAVLVLISRAHVVDFDALTELVLAGRIKAAIDVFPMEPMPLDHPIRRAPGAVLSAHRAGAVQEGLWEIGQMVVDDLEAVARQLPPQRLQVAQPETVARFASMAAGKPPQK